MAVTALRPSCFISTDIGGVWDLGFRAWGLGFGVWGFSVV